MSEENVELFKGSRAYNRRDIEAMLVISTPSRVVRRLHGVLEGKATVYHGHEGLSDRGKTWTTFSKKCVSREIRDLGDTVLALGRLHARQGQRRRFGIGLAHPYREQPWRWGSDIPEAAEALEAAGLSE